MRVNVRDAVVTVKWIPFMHRTETAPEEGGYFEVVDIEGIFTDDEIPDIEDEALAYAWDSDIIDHI